MYESLLSTVFQSITYEIATISAYKMNVIRICHHSIIYPFFFLGNLTAISWLHLIQQKNVDYTSSSAQQKKNPKNKGSSMLSNVI